LLNRSSLDSFGAMLARLSEVWLLQVPLHMDFIGCARGAEASLGAAKHLSNLDLEKVTPHFESLSTGLQLPEKEPMNESARHGGMQESTLPTGDVAKVQSWLST